MPVLVLTNLGAILRTSELHRGTLCLCDLNARGLEQIEQLARRINAEWGANMQIEANCDRRKLLPGADFVIISVAIDREKCWREDHATVKNMVSSIMLRTAVPEVFSCCTQSCTVDAGVERYRSVGASSTCA